MPGLPADSVARIKDALTATLVEQRSVGDASGRPSSPWDLLLDDSCTWRLHAHWNAALCGSLRQHFDTAVTREILLAASGVKVSRTCLPDEKLDILRPLAEQYGFCILASEDRYFHSRDRGKGCGSNLIERVARADEAGGLRNVYIACDSELCHSAVTLEEAGDDEIFGTLLGIPACCRQAYMERTAAAVAHQNDFVLLTLRNTPGFGPYNFWLNYPAAYFGASLISFFPCSFGCARAADIATVTFNMMEACDRSWARRTMTLLHSNILYTDFEGVHLFLSPFEERHIRYRPSDYRCTERTELSETVAAGNVLEVLEPNHVVVWRDDEPLRSLRGEFIGMCTFL